MEQDTVLSLLERKSAGKRFIQESPSLAPRSKETTLRMRRGLRRMARKNRQYKPSSTTDILWDSATSSFWKTAAFFIIVLSEVVLFYLELFPRDYCFIIVILTGTCFLGLLVIDAWVAGKPTRRQGKLKLTRKRRLRKKRS